MGCDTSRDDTLPFRERRDVTRGALVSLRDALRADILVRMRTVRDAEADPTRPSDLDDVFDTSHADDIALKLIEMKAQLVTRVAEAIRRVDDGTFGYCADCESPISPSRLTALPCAIRCTTCEDEREQRLHAGPRPQYRDGQHLRLMDQHEVV